MSDSQRDQLRRAGFTDDYITAMYRAEQARCLNCGKSQLSHSARFVREACSTRKADYKQLLYDRAQTEH